MALPDVSYGASLRATLRATAAAYGYTLTTATTLAVLTATHGLPGPWEVVLFALGGLLAFAVLEALVAVLEPGEERPPPPAFPFAGALNILAVGVALGAADGLGHALGSSIAWFLAPLVATALYMLVVAGQALVVARLTISRRRR